MPIDTQATSVQVFTENQGIEAYLVIRGQPHGALTADELKEKIHSYNIVYGLDFNAIEDARLLYRKSTSHVNIKTLIARGKPAVEGKNGELEFLIKESKGVVISETGQADFRNIQKYHPVKADELLVRRTLAIQGKKGVRVTGEFITPQPVTDPELRYGDNVVASPDGLEYRAKVSGIYLRDRNYIDVNPVLVISGNVGLETGNISYEGDIVVKGSVEVESKVETQANLQVEANVDSHMLSVGGNLLVKGGITSGPDGAIRVKGMVTGGFMEHSKVHAEGGIHLKKSAISCTLISGGGVSLPGKGSMLAGGEITAFADVDADQIGNKSGTITKIYLAYHYFITQEWEAVQKELEEAAKRHAQLTNDIEKIKLYAARVKNQIPADKKETFVKVFSDYKTVRDRYQNLGMKAELLAGRKINRHDVVITARESFYPGVEIHFGGVIKRIDRKTGPMAYRFKYGERAPVPESPAPR